MVEEDVGFVSRAPWSHGPCETFMGSLTGVYDAEGARIGLFQKAEDAKHVADLSNRISALEAQLAEAKIPTHRHKKRGSEYVLIGIGKMQALEWGDLKGQNSPTDGRYIGTVDMREVAIYRSATDPAQIWVRPREEFEDGRFEEIARAFAEKAGA